MIVPALIVIGIAWWCRRYWSMRFWLAAAILYWLIPFGDRAIFNASNGSGIKRGPPAWLTSPFYCLSEVSWFLLLALLCLGLLSFHPATRWIDHARHRNSILLALVLSAVGTLGFFGWRETKLQKIAPLDPVTQFCAERPQATGLSVRLEAVQTTFRETDPQYRITLTNNSDADVHLNGLPVGRFRFHPNPYFTQRRDDGRQFSWGSELKFPRDDELLPPGTSRTVLFPEQLPHTKRYDLDRGDPFELTAGDYTAFVSFWLQEKGQFQRVLSNVIHFRCESPKSFPSDHE